MGCCIRKIAITIKRYCAAILLIFFCGNVSAIIDYEAINPLMIISDGAVSDKSLKFYSFTHAQYFFSAELADAQLPLNVVIPAGQSAEMLVEWTIDGESWQFISSE